MTTRPTFGDFATAATTHLDRAAAPARPTTRRRAASRPIQPEEFSRSLAHVLDVMARYLSDITAPAASMSASSREQLTPWARASIGAQEAVHNAAALLQPYRVETGRSRRSRAADPGCGLDAAAASMTAGRDLLHTHLTTAPDGTSRYRSDWAPAITSAPITVRCSSKSASGHTRSHRKAPS